MTTTYTTHCDRCGQNLRDSDDYWVLSYRGSLPRRADGALVLPTGLQFGGESVHMVDLCVECVSTLST